MKRFVSLVLLVCSTIFAQSQLRNNDVYKLTEINKSPIRETLSIPNIDGYITLKCDFHTHTVFSDGKVWPDIRVKEAWQEGLDAIAITDHIEYRPMKKIVIGDLNESFKIAKKEGDQRGVIVIHGIEITRKKPIGHLNALFITDANPMDTPNPVDAIDIALNQGAFIMWNHPGWPDNKSTLYPIHDTLINEKKIHGVEVFNHKEYYPLTFDWCVKYNLAFMGNSDLHNTVKLDYGSEKLSRPITLVFATEHSEKGIKEALFAGRSAALFNGTLAGKPEHLTELVRASLRTKLLNEKKGVYEISNLSDISYTILINNHQHILHAGKTRQISLPKDGDIEILNCYIGLNKHLKINLPL